MRSPLRLRLRSDLCSLVAVVLCRQYVERCFKTAKPSQRPNLQQALRLIIQDAQVNGQLYSRPWSSLPPPDLSLRPDQAASVVISVAGGGVGGVGGVCGAGGAAGVGGGAGGRASRFDVGPPGAGQGYGQGYGHGDPGPGGVHGGTYGGSYGQPPSGLQPPPGLYHQHPMHQQYVHHQQPPVAYTPVNPPPIQKPSMVRCLIRRRRPMIVVATFGPHARGNIAHIAGEFFEKAHAGGPIPARRRVPGAAAPAAAAGAARAKVSEGAKAQAKEIQI